MYNILYNKFKITLKSTLLCVLILTIFIATPTSIRADTTKEVPDPVYQASNSVIQLVLSCTDKNGNIYYIHQGTGFVAGTTENTQYILTTNEVVTATTEQLNQIRKWGGLSSEDTLTTQVSILLDSDILIPANVTSTGTGIPYALLTPELPLNDVSVPKFNFSSNVTRGQAAYGYGYNADMLLLGQVSLPQFAPTFRTGNITDINLNPLWISSDITAESGFTGAPLFDENGFIIGMCYQFNGNMEILPSDSIIDLLESLNISHLTNALNSDYNVADNTIKQELSDLLSDCQQDVTLNGNRYSEKTLTAYKEAIQTAMEVSTNVQSTKDDYQSSIDGLKKARNKLKPHNFIFRVIQLIVAAVLLLLLVINIRQYLKSQKLYRTLHPELSQRKHNKNTAALVRVNTNEVIWLTAKELRIGSDPGKVDYLISDNSAISRYHAAIIQKDYQYYIIDNHSTNHTSVNHSILSPGQPWRLSEHDTILLADEPFQFHLMDA